MATVGVCIESRLVDTLIAGGGRAMKDDPKDDPGLLAARVTA